MPAFLPVAGKKLITFIFLKLSESLIFVLSVHPYLQNYDDNIISYYITAYTMAKYGMSMCVLGMAEEFRDAGVAVNALWPRTGKLL